MKVLLVDGGDYAASEFERSEYFNNLAETWEKANVHPIIDDDLGCDIQAYSFDCKVSDDFVKFVKNQVMDYDHGKHQNFYIVK